MESLIVHHRLTKLKALSMYYAALILVGGFFVALGAGLLLGYGLISIATFYVAVAGAIAFIGFAIGIQWVCNQLCG